METKTINKTRITFKDAEGEKFIIDEARAFLAEQGEGEEEAEKIIALAISEGLTFGELDEISHERENEFRYAGNDFKVCTDEQADEEMIEECKQMAWAFTASFLASFCNLDEDVFIALQDKCEGSNDAVISLIERCGGGIEAFAKEAGDADGRGHFLNRYDGTEEKQEVNGVTYYIYRS